MQLPLPVRFPCLLVTLPALSHAVSFLNPYPKLRTLIPRVVGMGVDPLLEGVDRGHPPHQPHHVGEMRLHRACGVPLIVEDSREMLAPDELHPGREHLC